MPDQKFFLSKLLGFNFTITYKPGKKNLAVDALSRVSANVEPMGVTFNSMVSILKNKFMDRVLADMLSYPFYEGLKKKSEVEGTAISWSEGMFRYHDRIALNPKSPLVSEILNEMHSSTLGSHSRVNRTIARIRLLFWWKGMGKRVKQFVAECVVCQQTKVSTNKPIGLLHPLAIPEEIWESISMDFITGLPKIKRQSVIITVVVHLSKFCHLGCLPANYTAISVAEFFVQNIVKIRGFLKSIISARDKVFISIFWKELMAKSRTTLKLSMTFRSETDSQSEIVNKKIETYL